MRGILALCAGLTSTRRIDITCGQTDAKIDAVIARFGRTERKATKAALIDQVVRQRGAFAMYKQKRRESPAFLDGSIAI